MDLLDGLERNILAHATRLHRPLPTARLLDAGDVVVADSGLADDTFNVVVRTRFDPAGADGRIAAVAAELAATGRPFAWCVGPASTPADLSARLAAAGIPPVERETAMALELAGFDPPAGPPELTVRLARTAAELADFAAVVAANWDPPAPTVHRVLAAGSPDASRYLVGYVDGRPVCTALLVDAAGLSGLYMVCTLTAHRGRGYARAVTAAALRRAGCPVAVLQASPQGEPVYRRLGFRALGAVAEHAVRPAPPA